MQNPFSPISKTVPEYCGKRCCISYSIGNFRYAKFPETFITQCRQVLLNTFPLEKTRLPRIPNKILMHQATCWAELSHHIMMSPKSRHASRTSHAAPAGAKCWAQGRVPCYLCMNSNAVTYEQGRRAEAVTLVALLHLPIIRLEVPADSVSSPNSPMPKSLLSHRDFYVGRVRKYKGK